METALLFCAIRAAEMLGTVAYAHDTRAGYEMSLCWRKVGNENYICLNSPALTLEVIGYPASYGVPSCLIPENAPKLKNKIQARLDPN